MTLQTFARWFLYPLLWIWTLVWIVWAIRSPDQISNALFVKALGTVSVLLLFEWLVPLAPGWGMTWRHLLRRDLVMIVVNGATVAGINFALLALSIAVATSADGVLAGRHLLLQVLVGLIGFEALQYTLHRLMHRNDGGITRFLWRCHCVHHLPQQLYVVMHAVGHPINGLFVRVLVQLSPIWLFGFDPLAVFIYGSVIALHGTISHLNVDMRLGWFNYLFIGPELHRYHHSGNSHEAMNYGATLSMFDLLFDTFVYRPGDQPLTLGLKKEDGYPGQHAPIAALLFPFR